MIEYYGVRLKSVEDPAVTVKLLRERAQLQTDGARFLLVRLVEVRHGLAVDLLEYYVKLFSFDGMFDGLDDAEPLEGRGCLFQAAGSLGGRAFGHRFADGRKIAQRVFKHEPLFDDRVGGRCRVFRGG